MRKICTRTCEVNLHFIRYIFTFSCHCNNTNVRGRRLNGKQRREIDRSEICMYRAPLYFFRHFAFDISHFKNTCTYMGYIFSHGKGEVTFRRSASWYFQYINSDKSSKTFQNAYADIALEKKYFYNAPRPFTLDCVLSCVENVPWSV